jgi:hypothetical protein
MAESQVHLRGSEVHLREPDRRPLPLPRELGPLSPRAGKCDKPSFLVDGPPHLGRKVLEIGQSLAALFCPEVGRIATPRTLSRRGVTRFHDAQKLLSWISSIES